MYNQRHPISHAVLLIVLLGTRHNIFEYKHIYIGTISIYSILLLYIVYQYSTGGCRYKMYKSIMPMT